MKIYNTSNNFPSENENKSDLFKIYKKILEKSDLKNYISMLNIIIQKIHKIDINIENEKKGLKIIYKINQRFCKAFLETDVKNSKETKNLFCLKLLYENFPYFCKVLYYYVHEALDSDLCLDCQKKKKIILL